MNARLDRRLLDLGVIALLTVTSFRIASLPVPSRASGDGAVREIDTLPPDRPGHGAATPASIPAPGWWDIIKRTVAGISNDRVLSEAAGVTFYALLALFPALAALVSLYGLVSDPKTISDNLSLVSGVIPEGGMTILTDQLHSLTASPAGALGFGAIFGLLTAIWSANAGMKALFDALNAVYEEKETRGFIFLTLLSLTFTLGALIFVILTLSAVIVVPTLLNFGVLGSGVSALLGYGRWPLLFVIVTLLLAVIFRYGPSRPAAKWRWVTWGGGFAALAWLAVSGGFSWYASHFGNYNKTYGSLGAAVGFMTWIWLSTTVVLIGGEMNAQIERQTGTKDAKHAGEGHDRDEKDGKAAA